MVGYKGNTLRRQEGFRPYRPKNIIEITMAFYTIDLLAEQLKDNLGFWLHDEQAYGIKRLGNNKDDTPNNSCNNNSIITLNRPKRIKI